MELSVLNSKGKDTGRKVNLNDAIFGVEPNDHAIYLDVKLIRANQRQGTSKTKQRAEVAGSTKKIKRQKGTGGARAGSLKSPVFKQGGNIHGPVPRDYEFKLNRKVKKLARKSALSYKAKANNITVLENLSFEKPKTSEFTGILKSLKVDNEKVLVVVADNNQNVILSSRNLPSASVISANELNTYDIMNAGKLVLTEGSIEALEKMFNN